MWVPATASPYRVTTTTSPPPPKDAIKESRRASNPNSSTPALHPARTRSVGGLLSADVIFERDPASPPTDEDIIIVTVRISHKGGRNTFDEPLPYR